MKLFNLAIIFGCDEVFWWSEIEEEDKNIVEAGDLEEAVMCQVSLPGSYRVRNYNFPSCVDCSNSQDCDYTEANEDCWGNSPSCADCLWSQGIVRCP